MAHIVNRVLGGWCSTLVAAAAASGVGHGGKSNALTKVVEVSPQLGSCLGLPKASRTDAVKKIWEYVKLHNLQNPANKKEIHCDEKLKIIYLTGKTQLDSRRLLSCCLGIL